MLYPGNDPRNKSDYSAQVDAELQPPPEQAQMMPPEMATALLGRDPLSGAEIARGTGSRELVDPARAFKVGLGPPGSRLTNQDFNPAGYRPNESRSAGVGKYQGSPIFAASIGAPFSVLNDRMDAIAREEAELQKAMADFDPLAGVKHPNAIKYQDSFADALLNGYEEQKANIIAGLGEEEGMRRMMNKSTPEGMALQRYVQHMNTVTANIDDAVNRSNAVQIGMKKGELQRNPILERQSKEVTDRLGSYEKMDIEELARVLPRFNANVALVDQLSADKVVEMIKAAGSINKVYEQVNSGDPLYQRGFRTLVGKKTVSYDDFVNALTDQYAPQYEGELSRDEVKSMIASMVPNTYEEDVKSQALKSSGGKGGSGSRTRSNAGPEQIVVPSETVDSTGKLVAKSVDAQGKEIERPSLALMKFTNNQGGLAAVDVFKAGKDRMDLIPTDLVNVDNELMIIGKGYGLPRAQMIKQAQAKGASSKDIDRLKALMDLKDKGTETSQEDEDFIQRFFTLQDVMVPAKGNWSRLENSFGIGEEAAKKQLGITTTGKPAAAPATKASEGASYYTDQSKPPPVAGARWNAGLGMYLVPGKKAGEWVKLRR